MDVRSPWLMVSIMLWRYISCYKEKYPEGVNTTVYSSFISRAPTHVATRMKVGPLGFVSAHSKDFHELDKMIRHMFSYYKLANSSADFVLTARAEMMSAVGKLAYETAQKVNDQQIALGGKVKDTDKTSNEIKALVAEKLPEIESAYRKGLEKGGVAIDQDLKYQPKQKKSVGLQGKGKPGQDTAMGTDVADQAWINAVHARANETPPGDGDEAEITPDAEAAPIYVSKNMVLHRLKIKPENFHGKDPVTVTSLKFLQDDLRTYFRYA